MPISRNFSDASVIAWLDELAIEQDLVYPTKLICWNSFESPDTERLASFGKMLEAEYGWEFVGMWPSEPGSSVFHLRVKRVEIADHDSVLRDVRQLEKMAEEAGVETYCSCEPQICTR